MIWSHSVLLPTPGAPVTPIMSARPATGAISRSSSAARPFSTRLAARASARWAPARTPFVSSAADSSMGMLALEQLARDHHALDLAGAFADGAQLHVPVELFDRIILDEPVAAVNLHGLIGGTHRGLRGVQLGHGRFLVNVCAVVLHPGGAQREQTRGVDFSGHIGQLILHRLKFGNEAAELLALLRIVERGLVRALRDAHRQRGNRNAAAVEDAQAVHKAFALFAAKLRCRHAAARENHLAGG